MFEDKYQILTGDEPRQSYDITEEIQLQAIHNYNIAKLQSMKREKFKNWD